jgi:hypothetical protein
MEMRNLRFIPTQVHGILDYTMGAVLSSGPIYLKGFKKVGRKWHKEEDDSVLEEKAKNLTIQEIIPYSMGLASTVYSLFTNYELGAVKKIPMKVHLALDAFSGAFLAASPWIFGFAKKVWIPFVAAGVFELGAALFTKFEEETLEHKLAQEYL